MNKFSNATARSLVLIAKRYLRDEPALVSSLDFGPFVAQGIGDGPSVLIGDQSEISLISGVSGNRLDHRMASLARIGDIVLVRQRDLEYERYLAQCLGLEDLHFVQIDNDPISPVCKQVQTSAEHLGILMKTAQDRGGLTLKSYLTTGNVWRLAQVIGEASETCIHVCGPSPRVTRRANDKLWFSQLAREVNGTDATPPTLFAFGPAGAAGLVRRICTKASQVVVKVPDSAGSAGNIRLHSSDLIGMTLAELRQFLLDRLHAMGWHDAYPILVGVWDDDVTHSPSVQLWLPHTADGGPIVGGIFEQRVQGGAAAFAGAVPSDLPSSTKARLSNEAVRIGQVLQQLGYYGRCSFDAVICEPTSGRHIIHWIECNGRWGGVSIPMTASKQLLPKCAHPCISVVQEVLPGPAMTTDDLRHRLKDVLFDRSQTPAGIVVLSSPQNARGTSVNLMAVAETQDVADEILTNAMQRLAQPA